MGSRLRLLSTLALGWGYARRWAGRLAGHAAGRPQSAPTRSAVSAGARFPLQSWGHCLPPAQPAWAADGGGVQCHVSAVRVPRAGGRAEARVARVRRGEAGRPVDHPWCLPRQIPRPHALSLNSTGASSTLTASLWVPRAWTGGPRHSCWRLARPRCGTRLGTPFGRVAAPQPLPTTSVCGDLRTNDWPGRRRQQRQNRWRLQR